MGAGPGNPDLITVKGRSLSRCRRNLLRRSLTFDFQELNKRQLDFGKRAGKVSIDQKLIGKLVVSTTKIIIKLYDSRETQAFLEG